MKTKIRVLFGHSSTLLSFLTAMQIGRDALNFDDEDVLNENINRKFRTSKNVPMNANMAFVLYKCESAKSSESPYKLRAFLNEHLIKIPGCKSLDCELNDFVNYLKFFTQTCVSTEDSCAVS